MLNDFRFTKFKVYGDSKNFYHEIVLVTAKFPREYWILADQLRRAALSVLLNIAEGSAKKPDRDFGRYLKICLGSINECVACLDVAFDEKLVKKADFDRLVSNSTAIAKQLGGFSKSL